MKDCEQEMKDMFWWHACLFFAFSILSVKISSRIRTDRHIGVVFCQFNPFFSHLLFTKFLRKS